MKRNRYPGSRRGKGSHVSAIFGVLIVTFVLGALLIAFLTTVDPNAPLNLNDHWLGRY